MKYLEDAAFAALTGRLHHALRARGCRVDGKLELYSMKRAGTLEKSYVAQLQDVWQQHLQQDETEAALLLQQQERLSRKLLQKKRSQSADFTVYQQQAQAEEERASAAAVPLSVEPKPVTSRDDESSSSKRRRSSSLDEGTSRAVRVAGSPSGSSSYPHKPVAGRAQRSVTHPPTTATSRQAQQRQPQILPAPSAPPLPWSKNQNERDALRKLVTNLILTLNAALTPDYDVQHVVLSGQGGPASALANTAIVPVSLPTCTRQVNHRLSKVAQLSGHDHNHNSTTTTASGPGARTEASSAGGSSSTASPSATRPSNTTLLMDIWTAIHEQTPLSECDIYTLDATAMEGIEPALQTTLLGGGGGGRSSPAVPMQQPPQQRSGAEPFPERAQQEGPHPTAEAPEEGEEIILEEEEEEEGTGGATTTVSSGSVTRTRDEDDSLDLDDGDQGNNNNNMSLEEEEDDDDEDPSDNYYSYYETNDDDEEYAEDREEYPSYLSPSTGMSSHRIHNSALHSSLLGAAPLPNEGRRLLEGAIDEEDDDDIVLVDNDSEEAVDDAVKDVDQSPVPLLWSFVYFFVHRQRKRIVLFTCIETMQR